MTALDSVRSELAEHERVIARGLKTFVEVGSALMDIRDARLYREDYATFEDYCQQRWNMTDRRARQLMDAASTVQAIEETGTTVPATESQARELSGLEPELAAEVMTKAAESGEKVTAARIREIREQVAPRPVAKVTETTTTETYVDTDTGEVVDAAQTRDEFMRDTLRKAEQEGDIIPLTGPASVSNPSSPAAVAAQAMREARNEPWAVLTTKIHADLIALRRWITDRGIQQLVDNRDATALPGYAEDCSALIKTLRELGSLGDELDAEIRSRRPLRRIQ